MRRQARWALLLAALVCLACCAVMRRGAMGAAVLIAEVHDGGLGAGVREFEVLGDVPTLLRSSRAFRSRLAEVMLESARGFGDCASVYWECAPIAPRKEDRTRPRFALRRAPALENRPPDRESFRAHFSASRFAHTAQFANLDGSSELVAPLPSRDADFSDLSAWLRATQDRAELRDELFRVVGNTLESALQRGHTVWLSTAGDGVAWLHFRIDLAPKYYTTPQYRVPQSGALIRLS
mmetsp:Transcript_5116/g.13733  ORF Transcript_5116/g.13733 Transcript_5116/m.13733 type:complete len:237 (-) Transcript_5116:2786-3496(-)